MDIQRCEESELRNLIEALIFASEKPLTIDKMKNIIGEVDRGDIVRCISSIMESFAQDRGFYLAEISDGYQFRTKPRFASYVQKLIQTKTQKFSLPALETLAIIAYRQPITRAEIESLRGVDAGGVIKNLLERRLIKIAGKKDVPGKPLMYGTTREFLEIFNLKDLRSLPTLTELSELGERSTYEQVELDL